jgi:hypothetical protein
VSKDETRVNFDKNVPLRDEPGNLIGEAVITMKHGEILITAQIRPDSTLGQELMRRQGPMILAFKDASPAAETVIDYRVFEQ